MIVRTDDVAFLTKIATHPRVWPWLSSDGQSVEEYVPVIHPLVHYLRFGDNGWFAFRCMNSVTYEGHVAMLPKVNADGALQSAIEWMWENTPAQKLVCMIPAASRHAVAFARRGGFKQEGRLSSAYQRNGKLHDLIVLGVQKCPVQ